MLTLFAVQTLAPNSKGPEFLLVGAEDAAQALGAAAQQCVQNGKEDTQLVAVFTRPELDQLVNQMKDVETSLASSKD